MAVWTWLAASIVVAWGVALAQSDGVRPLS